MGRESEGQVLIKRQTWTKTARNGDVIGRSSQILLSLMWAITCNGSLTFGSAVIHGSKEFVSGILYVALTRLLKTFQGPNVPKKVSLITLKLKQ